VNLLPVSYQAQAALTVSAPVTGLTLNEVGHAVSGVVRVNGAVPSRNVAYCQSNLSDQIGVVRFSEKALGYSAAVPILCSTSSFDWQTLLPPGTYEVRVDRGAYGVSAQVNLLGLSYLAQEALVVSGPTANVTLDEVARSISGRVTVNGQVPTRSFAYCEGNQSDQIGVVRFSDKTRSYSASAVILCSTTDFSFSATLPPGVWDLRVERGAYGASAGVNLLPVSYLAVERLLVQ
jgi:hypothetical protein